jgi:GNAT superfamily N-acetyltransferase
MLTRDFTATAQPAHNACRMFCPPDLAARIERAEGRLCAAIAEIALKGPNAPFVRAVQIAGGLAVFTSPGAPTSKWMGGGFDAALDLTGLEEVEAHFAARGARLPAWVSTLADPALAPALCERGYAPDGFEHVLGHPVHPLPPETPLRVTRLAATESDLLAEIMAAALAHPDATGAAMDRVPPMGELRRWAANMTRLDGFRGYVGWLGDDPAGVATLRLDDEIAQFIGAGTLPHLRRRGVQTALLRARLVEAAAAGCRVAVIVTPPGSKSQQNAQGQGFSLLYARQRLDKAPPPSIEG